MKKLIARITGLDVELEAAQDLIAEFRGQAQQARAELAELRHSRDAAIEALLLENTRLKDQLAKAG